MEWILVITLMLGEQQKQVVIQSFDYIGCKVMKGSAPEKKYIVDSAEAKVLSVQCIKQKPS